METIDPAAGAPHLFADDADDDETQPNQVLPPVVAVLVTHDPGPWLEGGIASLAEQDYPALSVLVLDNGSAEDPTSRIAEVMPNAFVRRRETEVPGGIGFADAANDALEAVEGAVFLLFCHDDVALEPDSVRVLVEEAYRSNAAIVGPKVVNYEHPETLLEVGMTIDHYGVAYSGLEPGEIDQEQHDGVRDVFFVSHAAMLVRTDLFHEVEGFDPETYPVDDIDLCWRARLAGARVVVAPDAVVRHHEAMATGARKLRVKDPQYIKVETQARVRMLCKSYSFTSLLWVLPFAFVLSTVEALGLLITGRGRRAVAVGAGWFAALRRPVALRQGRHQAQQHRRVEDGEIRSLMVRGSARAREFFAYRLHPSDRLAEVSSRSREAVTHASGGLQRTPLVLAGILGFLILFGSRGLVLGRIPAITGFQTWPGVADAWSTFTTSWRTTFMGAPDAATPAFGVMSLIDLLVLGQTGLARSLVLAAMLPLGTWGVYRLVRPFAASALPAVAGAATYAVNPIVRNAIWDGDLGAIVCFALAPFVLGVLVRYANAPAPDARARRHAVCALALLVAGAGVVWPPALLLALFIVATFVLAGPFAGDVARRTFLPALGGTILALLLAMPWAWSLVGADRMTLGVDPRWGLSLIDILRFETGRAGAGIAPWGIVAAAIVPLAAATGPRLAWAMRAWVLAFASFALVWVPGRLAGDGAVPAPNALLVGAALGLAFAAGLGVAAVLDDIRSFHFGWRQVVTVVGAAGLVVATFGFAADTLSGRWGLPDDDWASTVKWMRRDTPPGGFRVLWVGDPNVLPADPKLAGSTGFALTRNGAGDARALWAAPEHDADRVIAAALGSAESGETTRLGHLLAPAGVRYIAFVRRAAPGGGATGVPQPALAAALDRQLDLSLSRLGEDGVVFENDAWLPMHSFVAPAATGLPVDARGADAALRVTTGGVEGVPVNNGTSPAIGPGTLVWSEAANAGWHASAGGETARRRDAFGWTNAFGLTGNAKVSVEYRGSVVPGLVRTLAVIGWGAVAVACFRTRRRERTTP